MASLVWFLAVLAAASATPASRIVGGEHTTIEDSPYAVAFTYYYPGPGIVVQRCVGTLVSSWHVLTTAFCFTGANLDQMQVRAGSANSLSGGLLRNIAKVEKHPDYTETPRSNDIAVTFLDEALGISNTINILYLPPVHIQIDDGEAMKVVSWGFESEEGPQLETLKSIYLNKISVEECEALYEENENVEISENVICATAEDKGVCLGDSGAPMVRNNIVVGISSFYKGCLDDEYPDVFTRVNKYTEWILDVASSRSSGVAARIAPVTL